METKDLAKYISSDSRRFELTHKPEIFKPLMFIEISQLEILKILNALKTCHSSVLHDKIKKYLNKVSSVHEEKIDYSRNLPKKAYDIDDAGGK